jgi:WD40 repeat protein
MKSNLFFHGKYFVGFIVSFFILIVCGSNLYASGANETNETILDSSGILSIDAAIREAAARIDERIEGATKIALTNFNSPSNQFSEYVLDELSANLVDSGKLIVVDRKEIDLIYGEYDFQTSGEVSDSSMQEIGQMLGAQSIVSGSLTDIGGLYRFMIRVLNVQSAAVEVQYRTDIANDNRVMALLTGQTSSAHPSVGQTGNDTINSPQSQSGNGQNTSNSSGIAASSQANIETEVLESIPAVKQTSNETSISYERFTALRKLDPMSGGEMVFTPDSKAIIAYNRTGNQGYIKLWDVETGKAIRTIRESGGFSHIAISPDGKRFVTWKSLMGNIILLWDFATGAYRECRGHASGGFSEIVYSLAFSPDGNYFISGASDKTIKIWSADTGQEIRTLTGHTGDVLSVSYSPDGRQIVSCSRDKTIKFWDLSSGNVIRSISANCSKVSYCPDGRKIAAVEGNKIHIFDGQNGRELFTLTGHRDVIRAIAFSPDGNRLLSADQGSGSNIIVWNMSNGWEIGRLNSKDSSYGITSLVISANGKYFVTSGAIIWGEE